MSVYNIEGDVYLGYAGSLITALDGNSGTVLANLAGRVFEAGMGSGVKYRRNGLERDQVTALSVGARMAQVRLNPRDLSADSRRLLFGALTNLGTGAVKTSGSGVSTVGQLIPTIQLWCKSLSGGLDYECFAPALALAPGQDFVSRWARDVSLYDGQTVILNATRPDGQSTPAMATGTNAQLGALYFA